MQQWYKSDVVKRFYLYHTVGTALQLEEIPMKTQIIGTDKVYESKDYRHLLPVITLIWMADDSLKFEEDFISFSVFPEEVANFVRDETNWASPIDIESLRLKRQTVVDILQNKSKNLDFLPQNRLIFAFQKNIVRNKKYSKYFDWFEFAEKTGNKNNSVEDFLPYSKDEIFMEIMRRIEQTSLPYSEFKEIEDYDKFLIQWQRFKDGWKEDYKEEFREEYGEEIREEVLEEVKAEVKQQTKKEAIISAYERGVTPSLIADVFGLPVEEIELIIASK
jgi:hypothetical protein